jgi:hypothetical protein
MRTLLFLLGFCFIFAQQTSPAFANCNLLCDKTWWSNADLPSLKLEIQDKDLSKLKDENGATPLHYAAITNAYPNAETSLYEVQMHDSYMENRRKIWPVVRDALRPERPTVGTIRLQMGEEDELVIKISKKSGMQRAIIVVEEALGLTNTNTQSQKEMEVSSKDDLLIIKFTEDWKKNTLANNLEDGRKIIRRRIREIGAIGDMPNLPQVFRYGDNHLLLNYQPNPLNQFVKSVITQKGHISFNSVVSIVTDQTVNPGLGNTLVPSMNEDGKYFVVNSRPIIDWWGVLDAFFSKGEANENVFTIRLNPTGSRKFSDFTKDNVGYPVAIILDGKVVSAPVISSHITNGYVSIPKNFDGEPRLKMYTFLRTGPLPDTLEEIKDISLAPPQADARLVTIIKSGVDINSVDNNRQTALHWAAKFGSPTFLRLLIKNGGNYKIKDNNGKTAVDYYKENPRFITVLD